jgi:hypothetical protein
MDPCNDRDTIEVGTQDPNLSATAKGECVPGPDVHFRMTARWAAEEGLDPLDAEAAGRASVLVDMKWPGRHRPLRHFNPTASLVYGPLELRRAIVASRAGDRDAALTHLGYSLHSYQDAVGHGRLAMNHLAFRAHLRRRDPDDWTLMSPAVQARIEGVTRRTVARFVAATG